MMSLYDIKLISSRLAQLGLAVKGKFGELEKRLATVENQGSKESKSRLNATLQILDEIRDNVAKLEERVEELEVHTYGGLETIIKENPDVSD